MSVLRNLTQEEIASLLTGDTVQLRISGLPGGHMTVYVSMITKYSKYVLEQFQQQQANMVAAQNLASYPSYNTTSTFAPHDALHSSHGRPAVNTWAPMNPNAQIYTPMNQQGSSQYPLQPPQYQTQQPTTIQSPPSGPVCVMLPPINHDALQFLVSYMVNCITKQDRQLEPPASTISTILLYEAIQVLKIPFAEKKFQASISDRFSKDDFSANDIRAVWERLRLLDPKTTQHCIQNVAYRIHTGLITEGGEMWEYLMSEPQLMRAVMERKQAIRTRGKSQGRFYGEF